MGAVSPPWSTTFFEGVVGGVAGGVVGGVVGDVVRGLVGGAVEAVVGGVVVTVSRGGGWMGVSNVPMPHM